MNSPDCACLDDSAYTCFADRQNLGMCSFEVVEAFGGPCECTCHYDDIDDSELAFEWGNEHE